MASPLSKLYNSMKKKDEEERYSNPYDNGSVWSEAPASSSSTSTPKLNFNTTRSGSAMSSALYNLNKSTNATDSGVDDYLEYARNQMNYYSENIEMSGNKVEEPEKKGLVSGALDILDKLTVVPRSIENFITGAMGGIQEEKTKQQEAIEKTEAFKKLQALGYTTDGSHIYDIQTGKAIKGYNGYDEEWKLFNEISKELKQTDSKSSGFDYLKSIGKESVNSFLNTYKASFGDTAYSDVSDVSNIYDRARNQNNTMGDIEKKMQSRGIVSSGLQKLGVEEETANSLQGITADIVAGMQLSKITDLGDVGKTIKYMNNSDDIKKAEKVANNLDEALDLARQSNKYDDFVANVENLSKAKKFDMPDEKTLGKMYDEFTRNYAKQLINKTSKTLGGMPDFDGLKLGNWGTVSRETLDKINKNKVASALTKAGLTMYSPVGGLVNSKTLGNISDAVGNTKIGKAVQETIDESFIGGSNNQWIKSAKEDPANALKSVNMKMSLDNANDVKYNNIKKHLAKAEEIKEATTEAQRQKITNILEKPEKQVKCYEEVEKEVINPAVTKELKGAVKKEMTNNTIETGVKEELTKNEKKIATVEKQMAQATEMESKTKKSISLSKQLKSQGIDKKTVDRLMKDKMLFKDSLQKSTNQLSRELKQLGYDNPTELARQLKTASNAVIDTVEDKAPGLIGKFDDLVTIEKRSMITQKYGSNYDTTHIDTVSQANNKKTMSEMLDNYKTKTKEEVSETVSTGTVRKIETDKNISSKEFTTADAKRREGRRQRILKDIKENNYKLTTSHKAMIEGGTEEDLRHYQQLVAQKKQYDSSVKNFKNVNKEYREFFEKEGIELNDNIAENLETLALYRKNGETTPIFKAGEGGKSDRLLNATTGEYVKPSAKQVETLARRVSKDELTNMNKTKEFIQKIYDNASYTEQNVKDKVIRELEAQGINLTTIEKQSVKEFIDPLDPKDNLNGLFNMLDDKIIGEKKELLSYLSKDEIQLYKDYLTKDYLDPLTDDVIQKVKNDSTVNWKEKNMYDGSVDTVDVGEEFIKREKWNAEAYENAEVKDMTETSPDTIFAKVNRPEGKIPDIKEENSRVEQAYQKYISEKKDLNEKQKQKFFEGLQDRYNEMTTKEKNKFANMTDDEIAEYIIGKQEDKIIKEAFTTKVKKTPIEAHVSSSKVESINKSIKTVKPLRKPSEAVQPITEGEKINGLRFKLESGADIVIDDKITAKDIAKINTENTLGTTYVYTKQPDGVTARTFHNDSEVWLNVGDAQIKAKDFKNVVDHENFHVIQNTFQEYKFTKEQTLTAMKEIRKLDGKQIDNLITIFAEQGMGDTTSRKLLDAGFISKYVASVKGQSKEIIGREANAVIGSLLTSSNSKVRKASQELFGEEVSNSFIKSLSDAKTSREIVNFTRTRYSDELANKMEKLSDISQTIKAKTAKNDEAWENNKILQDILDDLDMDTDNLDYADRVINRLNEFDDLTGGEGSKAIEGLKIRLTFKQNVEKLETVDLTKELSEEEMKIFTDVQNAFKHFGMEEELGNLRTNYVTHVLNPDLKADKEALRIARDKFGTSFEEVFNVNGIQRKYEGTIEAMNKSFGKALDEQGIDIINKKLFLDDISDIYINRAVAHEELMYKKNIQDSFIKTMAKERVVNFQTLVDSEETARNTIESLIKTYPRVDGAEEISDELINGLVKDFKGSNRTLYQWLKKEGKDKLQLKSDIANIDIRELNANDFAKNKVYDFFHLEQSGINSDGIRKLDDDYIRYNRQKGMQEYSSKAEKLYEEKKEFINKLIEDGADPKAFKDMREEATKKSKVLVTNGDIRIEADKEWRNFINGKTTEDRLTALAETDATIWKQNYRAERRKFYQESDQYMFAYTDIEIDWKKVYDGMTDKYMRDNDMILITKKGKNEVKQYNVVANNADDLKLTADNFNEYTVVKNVMEYSGDTRYMIRKSNWKAYQKTIEEQAKKDTNIFLKAYDKVLQIFKTQALGTGRFVANTAFGNMFESYFTAGVNLMNPKMIKEFWNYKKGKPINIAGLTNADIAIGMEKLGANNTQIGEEVFKDKTYRALRKLDGEELSPLSKIAEKVAPVNPFSSDFKLYKATNSASEIIEEMSRFINVATQLKRGKSFAEAVDLTNKALFKYSDLTYFEKNTMKRIIPFYAFMRNNLPLQLNNIMDNPAKYGRLVDVYKQANQQLATEQERNLTPDYADMYLRLSGNKMLNLQIPFDTINDITSPSELLSNVNPLIKTPLELALNYKSYSQTQISKYGEAKDYVEYAVQNLFPFFYTYTKALTNAKNGDYEKLANLMGLPVKTFDMKNMEKQKIYNYVDELEKQWYRIAEENPELAEYVKAMNNSKSTYTKKSTPLYNISKGKNTPLGKLLN